MDEKCIYCDTVMGSLIKLTNGWCCAKCFKKIILQLPSGDGKGGSEGGIPAGEGHPSVTPLAAPEAPEGESMPIAIEWKVCSQCRMTDECESCTNVKALKVEAGEKLANAALAAELADGRIAELKAKLATAEKSIYDYQVGYMKDHDRIDELEAKLAAAVMAGTAMESANRMLKEKLAAAYREGATNQFEADKKDRVVLAAEIERLDKELAKLRSSFTNHNLTDPTTKHIHTLCPCAVPPHPHCQWCGAKMPITSPAAEKYCPLCRWEVARVGHREGCKYPITSPAAASGSRVAGAVADSEAAAPEPNRASAPADTAGDRPLDRMDQIAKDSLEIRELLKAHAREAKP